MALYIMLAMLTGCLILSFAILFFQLRENDKLEDIIDILEEKIEEENLELIIEIKELREIIKEYQRENTRLINK